MPMSQGDGKAKELKTIGDVLQADSRLDQTERAELQAARHSQEDVHQGFPRRRRSLGQAIESAQQSLAEAPAPQQALLRHASGSSELEERHRMQTNTPKMGRAAVAAASGSMVTLGDVCSAEHKSRSGKGLSKSMLEARGSKQTLGGSVLNLGDIDTSDKPGGWGLGEIPRQLSPKDKRGSSLGDILGGPKAKVQPADNVGRVWNGLKRLVSTGSPQPSPGPSPRSDAHLRKKQAEESYKDILATHAMQARTEAAQKSEKANLVKKLGEQRRHSADRSTRAEELNADEQQTTISDGSFPRLISSGAASLHSAGNAAMQSPVGAGEACDPEDECEGISEPEMSMPALSSSVGCRKERVSGFY